jgi:hypothetical protein
MSQKKRPVVLFVVPRRHPRPSKYAPISDAELAGLYGLREIVTLDDIVSLMMPVPPSPTLRTFVPEVRSRMGRMDALE